MPQSNNNPAVNIYVPHKTVFRCPQWKRYAHSTPEEQTIKF